MGGEFSAMKDGHAPHQQAAADIARWLTTRQNRPWPWPWHGWRWHEQLNGAVFSCWPLATRWRGPRWGSQPARSSHEPPQVRSRPGRAEQSRPPSRTKVFAKRRCPRGKRRRGREGGGEDLPSRDAAGEGGNLPREKNADTVLTPFPPAPRV